ncbi:hypothetical protein, partial [Citrobacter braakii]|uniref:hypothetical protein n=1 Tax=Citrobacter braakii TaxID=57706 RepID=UPI0019823223
VSKHAKATLTKAKDAALAGDLTSLKMLKTSIASWNAPKTKTVIDSLISSLEKAGASGVQPAAAAAPAATLSSSMVESVDGWKDLGGQGGYTDGSFHTDPSGQKWYVKFH